MKSVPEASERRVWRRVWRNRLSRWSLVVVLIIAGIAIFSPLLANEKPLWMRWQGRVYFPAAYDYPLISPASELLDAGFRDVVQFMERNREDREFSHLMPPVPFSAHTVCLADRFARPGQARHRLGADDIGRDIAARLIHGTVISLTIGLVAVGIAFSIGISIGAIAGYCGGWTDILLSRIMEIIDSIPLLLLLLILIAAMERPSLYHTMAVIGLTGWPGMARIFRGEVLKIRSREYVLAAHTLGSGWWTIFLRHLLPNAVAPVLVAVSFGVASAILTESMLSFLGFGDPQFPSWGEIIEQGRQHIHSWHMVVFPGIAIFVTVTAFNLIGDALRDAMDVRMAR